MKNRIFHNWALKVSSVVIAVVLWFVIYTIDDQPSTKYLYNVPVTFLNTEAITDDDKVYQVLDGTDVVRRITIKTTTSVSADLRDSDIKVEADFSKMKLDGTVELNIYSERHNDDITFKATSEELRLKVEDKVQKYLSLDSEMKGQLAEGYIIGADKLSPNRISVSGAESIMNTISKAVAVVDISGVSEDMFTYADIVLYDAAGNEVSKERLEMDMTQVSATVEVLATKKVPVTYVAVGTPAEGFVPKGEYTSAITEVVIAGKRSVLNSVSEIVVQDEAITLENAAQDVMVRVDLDNYLPAGIIRADRQTHNGQVDVTFHIAPIVDREITLRAGQVEITNIPEGYGIEYVSRSAEFKVVVRGADYLLEGLSSSDIRATVDIAAWMAETGEETLVNDGAYIAVPVYEEGEFFEVVASAPIEIIAKVLEE